MVHLPPTDQNWQKVAIKEPERTVLLQIINDNINDMDCVMIQQMMQARTSMHKGGTVNCAENVVESRMKDLQAKREEERKTAENLKISNHKKER